MSASHSPMPATSAPARPDPLPAVTLRAQKARVDYLTGVSVCRHACGACDQCREDALADAEIAVLEAVISAAETAPYDRGRTATADAP